MVKVSVIQQGGDFYVTDACGEFLVAAPFEVDATNFFANQRAFAWFDRLCQVAGYEATFVEA